MGEGLNWWIGKVGGRDLDFLPVTNITAEQTDLTAPRNNIDATTSFSNYR